MLPIRTGWLRRPICCLALLLCGCTGLREYIHNGFEVGPDYRRPPAPVAERWIDADDVRIRSEKVDDSQWWAVFNDPVLNGLVQTAYQQNLSVREAGFRVLEARAQRAIACGSLFPQQQQAYADYNRNKISKKISNQIFAPDKWFSIYDGGFNLAWELDFWGRFRRALESADADLDASVENYDDVLVTLIGDIANTYLQLRTFQQRIRYARENVALQSKNLVIVTAKTKGGEGKFGNLEVDQSTSDLAQLQASIPGFQIQVRQLANQLCTLLGVPPRDLEAELGIADIPAPPLEVAVGIPGELLRRRPDVRRAERQVAAQSAQIGVAEAELYPQIAIVGAIGLEANQFGDLFGPGASTGTIGPSLRWNILNYGRLLNNVRFQDARFQELAARYQNTVLRANQEVEDGLVAFLKTKEQVLYLAKSVDAAADAVRIGTANYDQGKVDFIWLAVLQENLAQQQDQLAQARGAAAQAVVQVYRALGGGWQIRCGGSASVPAAVVQPEPLPQPREMPAPLPQVVPQPAAMLRPRSPYSMPQ